MKHKSFTKAAEAGDGTLFKTLSMWLFMQSDCGKGSITNRLLKVFYCVFSHTLSMQTLTRVRYGMLNPLLKVPFCATTTGTEPATSRHCKPATTPGHHSLDIYKYIVHSRTLHFLLHAQKRTLSPPALPKLNKHNYSCHFSALEISFMHAVYDEKKNI